MDGQKDRQGQSQTDRGIKIRMNRKKHRQEESQTERWTEVQKYE